MFGDTRLATEADIAFFIRDLRGTVTNKCRPSVLDVRRGSPRERKLEEAARGFVGWEPTQQIRAFPASQ
jgi:hypothetical protein